MSAPIVVGDQTPSVAELQGREIAAALAESTKPIRVVSPDPVRVQQLPSAEFTVRQASLDVSALVTTQPSATVVHLVKQDLTRGRARIRAVGGDIIVAPSQSECAAGSGLVTAALELVLETTADIYVRAAVAGGTPVYAVAWCERWTD